MSLKHERQVIRDKIVAKLIAANIGGVNESVFPSAFAAISVLPAIRVYFTREQAIKSGKDGNYERSAEVSIEISASAVAGVENQVDAICAEVEVAMVGAGGGDVHNLTLVQTEFERSREGDKPIMGASLVYAVAYSTPVRDPTIYSH